MLGGGVGVDARLAEVGDDLGAEILVITRPSSPGVSMSDCDIPLCMATCIISEFST